MTIKISTGLRNSLITAAGESLATSLNDGQIDIYSGTPPATADAAVTGTLLVTVSDNSQAIGAGTGLDFDAAVGAVLSKAAAQTWSGVNAATGVASYYRFVQQADTGVLSTTEKRVQGTVSTVGADLNLSSTSLTISGTQSIDAFSITMPTP